MVTRKTKKTDQQPSKIIDIFIPQMGEGLQEVKILRFLKQPGDSIKEEDVIYEMETDKSTVEIESAHAGTLIEWLAPEDTYLAVGAAVGRLAVTAAHTIPTAAVVVIEQQSTSKEINVEIDKPENLSVEQRHSIPPRTRAYCKAKGISLEEMVQISAAHQKLLPEDVDNYLKLKQQALSESNSCYHDITLPAQQQLLIQRFKRSQQNIIPATLVSMLKANILNLATRQLIATNMLDTTALFISEFPILTYAVAQVAKNFPKFRSMFISENRVRENNSVNLGLAVQRANGDLVTAVVEAADTLDFPAFINVFQQKIQAANEGSDQAKQAPHILLSYMGQTGIIAGAPVLVEPAVAILFLGTSYRQEGESIINLSLTFDHRLINGMEAAAFLEAINEFLTLLCNADSYKTIQKLPVAEAERQPISMGEAQTWLLKELSNLLDSTVEGIDLNESLGLQGMDSIQAVKLTKSLEEYFQESFSATLIWHYPTVMALLNYLQQRFNLVAENDTKEENLESESLDKLLENLSADELQQLLKEIP